jgi:anti-sigma factor RsiW
MLTDQHHQLLTAYVDGELTPRQYEAVMRLLQGSADARDLVRRMQQDAEAVRNLRRQKPSRDLAPPIMEIIAERRLRPGARRRSVERPQPRLAAWAGFCAAAAALIMVAIGSYLYFSASVSDKTEPDMLAKRNGEPEPAVKVERTPEPAPEPKKPAETVVDKQPEPGPAPAAVGVAEATNPVKPTDVVGAPVDPVVGMEMFQKAQVTKLQILKLAELDQEARRRELLTDLSKEPAFRMESPVKDSIKAFERLKAALIARGITLVIDQAAQFRLTPTARAARLKTNFVLYVEDVTPDELIQLFQLAAAEDRKAEKIKKGETQFEAVVINKMTDADSEELCKLLGLKTKKLPDPPTGPLGVDIRKPLSEKTGDEITKNLTGQGGVPRPEPGKITPKVSERLALVMPYNPVRPRSDSPEIKRFLAGRKAPRPGTVHVLLVLREVSA